MMLDTIRPQRNLSWRSNTGGVGGFLGGKAEAPELADIPPPPSTPSQQQQPTAAGHHGPRPSCGAATLTSIGKGTSENQDSYVTTVNSTGSKCFVAVFDGHGEKGHHISGFAKKALTASLFGNKDLHTEPRSALEVAYDTTQSQIERNYPTDASYSGTTAVAAYQHRDRLLVANVGDSRAVLGVRQSHGRKTPSPAGGQLRAVELSRDHKPSRPDEKNRITAEGGIVAQGAIPVQTHDGIRMMKVGPERIMDKSGMGGLAVSRSLGDLSLRPYVSSKPEVIDRRLGVNDKVLILGSDGVWDHVSSQEAVDIAGRVSNPSQAARMIADVARKRWRAETQGHLSDDITAVVVNLDHDQQSNSVSTPHLPSNPSLPRASTVTPKAGLRERNDRTMPSLTQALPPAPADGSHDPLRQDPLRLDPLRQTLGNRSGSSRRGRRSPGESHSMPSTRRTLGAAGSGNPMPNHLLPAAGLRRRQP